MGLFSSLGLGAPLMFWQQPSPFVNPADFPEIPGLQPPLDHEARMKRIQELREQVQGMMPQVQQQPMPPPIAPQPEQPESRVTPEAGQAWLDQMNGHSDARTRGARAMLGAMENRLPGSSIKPRNAQLWQMAGRPMPTDGQDAISPEQEAAMAQNIAGAQANPRAYEMGTGMGPQLRDHLRPMLTAPDRTQQEADARFMADLKNQQELQERLMRVAPGSEGDSPLDGLNNAGTYPAGGAEAIAARLEQIRQERVQQENNMFSARAQKFGAEKGAQLPWRNLTASEMAAPWDTAMREKHDEYMDHLSPKNQMAARVMALQDANLGKLYRQDYPEYVRVTGGGESGYEDAQIAAAEANARQLYARGDQAGGDRAMQYAQMLRHYKAQRMDTEARSQQANAQNAIAREEAEGNRLFKESQIKITEKEQRDQEMANWRGVLQQAEENLKARGKAQPSRMEILEEATRIWGGTPPAGAVPAPPVPAPGATAPGTTPSSVPPGGSAFDPVSNLPDIAASKYVPQTYIPEANDAAEIANEYKTYYSPVRSALAEATKKYNKKSQVLGYVLEQDPNIVFLRPRALRAILSDFTPQEILDAAVFFSQSRDFWVPVPRAIAGRIPDIGSDPERGPVISGTAAANMFLESLGQEGSLTRGTRPFREYSDEERAPHPWMKEPGSWRHHRGYRKPAPTNGPRIGPPGIFWR